MEYELNDDVNFIDEVASLAGGVPSNLDSEATAANLGKKKFEQEISKICKKYGDLEKMREKLNFSRRQICEYLMVDPSAWSRWTNGDKVSAPPHVYRTMALVMEQNKNKFHTIRQDSTGIKQDLIGSAQAEALKEKLELTFKQNEKYQVLTMGWKVLLILNSIFLLYILFR